MTRRTAQQRRTPTGTGTGTGTPPDTPAGKRAPTCTACGEPRPMELRMTARGGEVLQLVSCPRCETRIWSADGRPLTQEELYRLASGDPEFALVAARRR